MGWSFHYVKKCIHYLKNTTQQQGGSNEWLKGEGGGCKYMRVAQKKESKKKKSWVSPCCPGSVSSPILGCNPATAPHGDFCLLRFRPGPIRPSSIYLIAPTSVELTMLMPSLTWTPDLHRRNDTPGLPNSCDPSNPGFQGHWITGARHDAQPR